MSDLSTQGLVLVVSSGLVLVLDTPPLIWHLKKKNVAPAMLIIWIILLNLMNFVNPFIWPDDNLTSRWEGYGLCDVQVKLQIGSWVGLPGALACIMRMLVAVLNTKKTSLAPTTAQKRRDLAFTITFCFVIPVIVMAVHYIVQPNRYAVWAIAGCTPTFDGSWLSLVLIYIWPLVISMLDAYYAIFLIIRMHRYRAEFSRLLQQSNTTKSRFLRLFLLSVVLVLVLFPWEAYILYKNIEYGVTSYSWSLTHSSAWQLIAPVKTHGTVLFDRWLRMTAGYAVFIFFGLGDDALRMYRAWLHKLSFGILCAGADGREPRKKSSANTWTSFCHRMKTLFSSQTSHEEITRSDKFPSRSSMSTVIGTPISKKYLSTSTQTDETLPNLNSHFYADSEGPVATEDPTVPMEDV